MATHKLSLSRLETFLFDACDILRGNVKAEQKILERLTLIEEKFQLKPATIKVLELRNRWASWTPKNGLNFHLKCIMAPVSVLDYIITHEMVHLKFPNHSTEFWNELDKKMPNYREYENWLKQNGVKLDL